MKCKAFDKILKDFNFHPHKVKNWLNDNRMSLLEKKIIEGHMLVRNNQNLEVINLITNLPKSEHEFVNAHKNLLLGIAHNNLTHFEEAQLFLKDAIYALQNLELNYYLFIAYFNQFMVFANINSLNEMRKTLALMEQTPREIRLLEIRLLRCQFMYAEKSGDIKGAKKLAHKISFLKPDMVESDLIAQLVSEFIFYIKTDEHENAREVLIQMKQHRKFNLSENYNFMKTLLDNLMKNTPVYAYEADFQAIPMLYHQLKVIQAFEAHDISVAKTYWNLLQEKFPNIYLDDFHYAGNKCLFSKCLDKYTSSSEADLKTPFANEGSLSDKLVAILKQSPVPLSKNYLYEILWGEEPVDKDDLGRLASQVKRIRAKYGIDIQSRKGTYFIVQKKAG